MCTGGESECLEKLVPDISMCLPDCEGTILPLIWQASHKIKLEEVYSDILKQYRKYKGDAVIAFPEALKGKD